MIHATRSYRILIDKSQEEIVAKLGELKTAIEKGDLKPWEFRGIKAIWFGKHLYQPLLYLDNQIVKITPVPLNKGECRFVEDLKAFHDGHADFFETRELYLLRNLSKGPRCGLFSKPATSTRTSSSGCSRPVSRRSSLWTPRESGTSRGTI